MSRGSLSGAWRASGDSSETLVPHAQRWWVTPLALQYCEPLGSFRLDFFALCIFFSRDLACFSACCLQWHVSDGGRISPWQLTHRNPATSLQSFHSRLLTSRGHPGNDSPCSLHYHAMELLKTFIYVIPLPSATIRLHRHGVGPRGVESRVTHLLVQFTGDQRKEGIQRQTQGSFRVDSIEGPSC